MNDANRPPTLVNAEQLAVQQIMRGENKANLDWVLENSSPLQLAAGEVLLNPEQDNNTLYLILDGRVQVRLDWQGHEALAYLGSGHCVGEMSVIEGKRPSAIVVTDEDCQLLAIDKEIVWQLIERSNSLARNLLYVLSSRVRKDNLVIFETRQQQAISEQNSIIDALTHLYNRRWLEKNVPRLISRSQQNSQSFCLLMLDIDHFKKFNDNHGHHAGDAALRLMGEILSENIRPYDSAARYGGEEFIILLPDTTALEARVIAERLREAVSSQSMQHHNGRSLPKLSASIGMAELKQRQDMSMLIEAADAALYRAKHGGRDCVAI